MYDHERMVSGIATWGVQWTGLPHSPKTDGDSLIEDNSPLPFQKSSDSNGPDQLRLDDLHQSSDCGGVTSIGLPMLRFCSPSFHDQQMHTAINT